jgi:hypothetical protein
VPKKLSERDLVPAFRRIRQIFADGIFNAKFAVLLQQEYKGCGELLCQRANPEFMQSRPRPSEGTVGWAIGSALSLR